MTRRSVRACLITNPRSGHGGVDLSAVLPVLHAHGWEITVRQKLRGGMASELARQAVRDGCEVIVKAAADRKAQYGVRRLAPREAEEWEAGL